MLGIVVALDEERRWISCGGPEPVVERSGIGDRRAEAAARRLVDRGVTGLASWGTAGGLDPTLGPGTVVIPRSVVVPESASFDCDPGWHRRLTDRLEDAAHPVFGPMLHVTDVIASREEKRRLYDEYGVLAVDMESGAIARVAKEHGLPFIVVRVVLDGAGVRLPRMTLTTRDGAKSGTAARLLWKIARRPREWGPVLQLARGFRVSGRAMKTVWRIAGPDLCLPQNS